MIPDIDPDPQCIKDYGEIIRWSQRGGTEAVVESFFKAYLRGSESVVDFRKATSAHWYYMTAPGEQLEKLLRNDEWANDALEFIRKNKSKELFLLPQSWLLGDCTQQAQKVRAWGAVRN